MNRLKLKSILSLKSISKKNNNEKEMYKRGIILYLLK